MGAILQPNGAVVKWGAARRLTSPAGWLLARQYDEHGHVVALCSPGLKAVHLGEELVTQSLRADWAGMADGLAQTIHTQEFDALPAGVRDAIGVQAPGGHLG